MFKFVQMSDPQLGFYASRHPETEGVEYEIENLSKAISITNEIKPDFVITTGDLVQDRLEQKHVDIIKELYATLNCPYYFTPGNSDLTNTPEKIDIERYRERFGADYYSFFHKDCHFIMLNSCVLSDWSKVPGENVIQTQFLENQLQVGKKFNSKYQFVFMHHPLFGTDPNEDDGHMVLPISQRSLILNLISKFDVKAVFTGHWHANNVISYKNTELITSGPITFPIGEDPSGIRIVEVDEEKLYHQYIIL